MGLIQKLMGFLPVLALAACTGTPAKPELATADAEVIEVTFSQLAARSDYYHGKRVRVKGLLADGSIGHFNYTGIFESVQGFYASNLDEIISVVMPASFPDTWESWEKINRSWIVLEGTYDNECPGPRCPFWFGKGILQDVKILSWLSEPWQRLSHDRLRELDWVWFDIVSREWSEYQAVEARAIDWLRAVRTGRIEPLLDGLYQEQYFHHWEPEEIDSVLKDLQESFGGFTEGIIEDPKRFAILVNEREEWKIKNNFPETAICFCQIEDCSDEWPLNFLDLLNNVYMLPFSCTIFRKNNNQLYWWF